MLFELTRRAIYERGSMGDCAIAAVKIFSKSSVTVMPSVCGVCFSKTAVCGGKTKSCLKR